MIGGGPKAVAVLVSFQPFQTFVDSAFDFILNGDIDSVADSYRAGRILVCRFQAYRGKAQANGESGADCLLRTKDERKNLLHDWTMHREQSEGENKLVDRTGHGISSVTIQLN